MSYTKWKSLDVIKELEENISGDNASSKNYSGTDSEETSTETYSEITDVVDPLR